MTAPELIALLAATRRHLLALSAEAGPAAQDEPGVSGDYALKDVLAHLTAYARAQPLWRCIVNDSVEHRRPHIPDIERWLAAREGA